MAKKIFEDMVRIKRENRLLDASKFESTNKANISKVAVEKVKEPIYIKEPVYPKRVPQTFSQIEEKIVHQDFKKSSADKPRNLIWFVALASVVFLLFALSFLFTRAKITVNPLTKDVALNKDFSAVLDSITSPLPFDLVVISGEETKSIEAGEKKDVALRALGTVVIFNDYSSATQALDIDTRLEGSNGKIYKTDKKIIVPGRKSDGTPGSVEVGIYASEAGEEYNSGPLDFKIFGFKGGLKYEKFYGRSKGDMTGGLKGNLPVISDEDKRVAVDSLKTSLQTKLLQKAIDQIPAGFILFKEAVFLTINEESIEAGETSNTATIKVRGTLHGFLLEEDKLTKIIAENSITPYDGSEIFIPNIRDLTFTLSNSVTPSKDVKNISFNLAGNTEIVFKVDEQKIIIDMLGKKKKEFKQVLLEYPNIESADLSIKPFWRRTVPEKAKHIKVITAYPK